MRPRPTPPALLLAVLWGALSCATVEASDEPLAEVRPDPRYDALFPYYVDLCAVSQIRAKFAAYGGTPGHAAMYVNGACRDPSTQFPTLKVCDASVGLDDPEAGSGVSVNKMFSNVNWIAVPGKRLFYFGNLGPEDLLDKERGVATLYEAEAAGIFSGVEIHGSYRPPPGDEEALLYLAAAETLGTDFALTFGRTAFCSRLPLDRRGLEDVIGYLNGLNREYALGEADYNWSGYNDNCSHTLHNALAAAGVWSHKSVGSYKIRQLLNLSVPANEFAELALLTTSFPIDDFDRIYRDRVLRESLLERGWLPTRHGALMKLIPVHQKNELYDSQMRIFMLRHPLRRSKGRSVGELFRDPRNTSLEANLLHFEKLYARILQERSADERTLPESDERREARAAYYRYVEAQLEDVRGKLKTLGGMPRREAR